MWRVVSFAVRRRMCGILYEVAKGINIRSEGEAMDLGEGDGELRITWEGDDDTGDVLDYVLHYYTWEWTWPPLFLLYM